MAEPRHDEIAKMARAHALEALDQANDYAAKGEDGIAAYRENLMETLGEVFADLTSNEIATAEITFDDATGNDMRDTMSLTEATRDPYGVPGLGD